LLDTAPSQNLDPGAENGKALALVVAMALVATRVTKAAADNPDFIDI
jgi:hypothetical protein